MQAGYKRLECTDEGMARQLFALKRSMARWASPSATAGTYRPQNPVPDDLAGWGQGQQVHVDDAANSHQLIGAGGKEFILIAPCRVGKGIDHELFFCKTPFNCLSLAVCIESCRNALLVQVIMHLSRCKPCCVMKNLNGSRHSTTLPGSLSNQPAKSDWVSLLQVSISMFLPRHK